MRVVCAEHDRGSLAFVKWKRVQENPLKTKHQGFGQNVRAIVSTKRERPAFVIEHDREDFLSSRDRGREIGSGVRLGSAFDLNFALCATCVAP